MKTGFPKVLKTGEKFCFKTVDSAVYNNEGYPLSDRITENNFHKLKFGIIGDGISGNKWDDNDNLIGYANLLANKFESYTNYSRSSMCIAKAKNPSNPTVDLANPAIITDYTKISDDLDIIMVACSSNDWNNDVPIESTDTGAAGLGPEYIYRSALESIITGLLTSYAGKEIIFLTPLHRHDTANTTNKYESSITPNAIGKVLADYVDVIKEVCEKHSVPVIDLFNTCGIDFENEVHRTLLTDNGVHPNKAGHYRIYRRIYSALTSLI